VPHSGVFIHSGGSFEPVVAPNVALIHSVFREGMRTPSGTGVCSAKSWSWTLDVRPDVLPAYGQRAQRATLRRPAPLLTEACRILLDRLLVLEAITGRTPLTWLRQGATANSPAAILTTFEKLAWLRGWGVDRWDLSSLTPNRVKFLAQVGRKTTNQALQRAPEARRYPILLAFLHQSLIDLTDEALDLFDGRIWQKSKADLIPLRRLGDTYLVGDRTADAAPPVLQRIILDPTGAATLFALNRPITVSGKLPRLFLDAFGDMRAAYPFAFQVSYEVLSHPKAFQAEALPPTSFLQIPALDPRILQLAERATEGIVGAKNKARALERFLKQSYRYSLEELPAGENDPLAAFLFEQRQGNCEYFASALAVMLRSLGVPARVVNGYLGGEWNPYGEYFLIRHSNAHSWVEAHFAGEGWVTLDPTTVPTRLPFASTTTSFPGVFGRPFGEASRGRSTRRPASATMARMPVSPRTPAGTAE